VPAELADEAPARFQRPPHAGDHHVGPLHPVECGVAEHGVELVREVEVLPVPDARVDAERPRRPDLLGARVEAHHGTTERRELGAEGTSAAAEIEDALARPGGQELDHGRPQLGDEARVARIAVGIPGLARAHGVPPRRRSCSRSSTRRILPLTVLGRPATNSMARGYLYGAVTRFTCSCSARVSSSPGAWPGRRTTNAFTISPRTGSGLATTADSSTAGCSRSALSTSKGPIRYPAEMMTSSARPTNQRYPSSSRWARSPVREYSPRRQARVSSGFFQYSRKSDGGVPRRASSPISPGGSSSPPSPTTRRSWPGKGFPIEPGRTGMPGRLAARRTVSVWP